MLGIARRVPASQVAGIVTQVWGDNTIIIGFPQPKLSRDASPVPNGLAFLVAEEASLTVGQRTVLDPCSRLKTKMYFSSYMPIPVIIIIIIY